MQDIHIIGKGDPPELRLRYMVIPAGPGGLFTRQNRFVCMQDRMIVLIGDGTQDFFFGVCRVLQHCQGLIAVGSNYHLIKIFCRAVFSLHLDMIRISPNRFHRTIDSDLIPVSLGQRLDVLFGAALDDLPLGLVAYIQKAVVFKKLGKIQGRKLVELNRIRRPDGLAHRNDKMFDKKPRKLSGGQKIFEGQTIVIAFKKLFGFSSEFENIKYHSIKRRAQKVPALDEKRIQRTGAEFKPGFFTLQTEAHVRRLPGNPQVFHQLDKIRIRFFVKYNKAGVYGIGCAI